MSIASAVYGLLTGDATVLEIVGEKVYPSGQPKQNTPPPMLMQEIVAADRPPLLNNVCRLTNYQIRITGVCKTEPELRRLMDAVEVRLDGYKGGEVKGCQLRDKSSNPDPTEPTFHSESHTYSVWHVRNQVGGND